VRELARLEAGVCELGCDATLLGLETRWSPGQVRNRLAEAGVAVERLPRLLELLEVGEIGAATLGHLVHTVSVLSVEQARELDARLADWTCGHTHQQITAKARRLVLKVDPEGAEARAGKRRTERRVEIEPDEDGIAHCGAAILAQIAAVATEPPDGSVAIWAKIAELLGGDAPGELAGYGPATAAVARALAAREARWRRVLTDPADGSVVAAEHKGYSPPTALAEHMRLRDRHRRFPTCSASAIRADLDHTVPHPAGSTRHGNLGALCRRHHKRKHDGGWSLTQPEPGHFIWRAPNGRSYHSRPGPP
jgi:hypothetical protein